MRKINILIQFICVALFAHTYTSDGSISERSLLEKKEATSLITALSSGDTENARLILSTMSDRERDSLLSYHNKESELTPVTAALSTNGCTAVNFIIPYNPWICFSTGIHYAMGFNLCIALDCLLRHPGVATYAKATLATSDMEFAYTNASPEVAQILLDYTVSLNVSRDSEMFKKVLAASLNHHVTKYNALRTPRDSNERIKELNGFLDNTCYLKLLPRDILFFTCSLIDDAPVAKHHFAMITLLLTHEATTPIRGTLIQSLMGEHDVSRNIRALSPFADICTSGKIELLQVLFNAGASVEISPGEKFSPLALAIKAGHMSCIRFLLERGASVVTAADNQQLTDALCIAVTGPAFSSKELHHEIVRTILVHYPRVRVPARTRMAIALSLNESKTVTAENPPHILNMLIEHGLPFSLDNLVQAINTENVHLVRFLLTHPVLTRNGKITRLLNASSSLALKTALSLPSLELVKLLIAYEADYERTGITSEIYFLMLSNRDVLYKRKLAAIMEYFQELQGNNWERVARTLQEPTMITAIVASVFSLYTSVSDALDKRGRHKK